MLTTDKQENALQPACLSINEAARFCGLSRSFLLRLEQEKRGPRRLKVGKRTLYLRVDLIFWLEAHAQTTKKDSTNND